MLRTVCALVCRLGDHARRLLNDLGGGHIQNLKFRDSWYFVGQKGIEGYTVYEQVTNRRRMRSLQVYFDPWID